MGQIGWLWWLILLASAAENHTWKNDGKIFGGREASNDEFNFVVYIQHPVGDQKFQICGATLATLCRIISAAHCFINEAKLNDATSYLAIGGSVDITEGVEEAQERSLVDIKVHEKYSAKTDGSFFHDIGVAHLNKPFTETSGLSPMTIVSHDREEFKNAWNEFVKTGKLCSTFGWGETDNYGTTSAILKVVELKPWTDVECSKTYKPEDDMSGKGEICMSQVRPNEGTCEGDSGSPIFCGGFVYGHSLGGIECGTPQEENFLLFWPYISYFNLSSTECSYCHRQTKSKSASITIHILSVTLLFLTTLAL